MARKKMRCYQKQGSNVQKKYEAPTCGELKRIRRHSLEWRWSKEDEVIVLDKLFQYSGENGIYTREFYDSVKNMLSIEVSENQLSYIIYCLRKQYLELHGKVKDLDSHSLKIFELSEKVWAVGNSSNSNSEGWPKTKALRDHYYKKSLQVYVVEELGFQADCLTSSVVEEIKKDWEDFLFVENEFRMMQQRFYLQLCELKSNIHTAQLQHRRRTF